MEKIVATNADKNVYKIYMLGASGTTDMTLWCLEWPVNKLVMLIENEWLQWCNDGAMSSISWHERSITFDML